MVTTARILDGTAVARQILDQAAVRAAGLPVTPCLATVIVGDDPASVTYVRMKQNRCQASGVASRLVALPDDTTTAELVRTLTDLSEDPTVHGILLQHPVGPGIDERAAFEAIVPHKDVDGVTLSSFAAMSFGLDGFRSCTPAAILRLLDAYDLPLAGRHAVVVGRSAILGKPVGMLLLERDATVTYCHSKTRDLASHLRTADIVVAAVGRPEFVRGDQLRPGAVVVDAGYNEGNVGDVDFASASAVASWITPVPGGVGPMTLALLIEQTVEAASRQAAGADSAS